MMTRTAFTLAEVLITLAVIGVIAALTIPAVITKATNEQHVTGLKKAYNTLKAVEKAAVEEHGPMKNWTGKTSKEYFEKYFKEHFDILKICEGTEKGCLADEMTWLDGQAFTKADFNTSDFCRFVTSDGMTWVSYGGVFLVDVNGLKGPNRWGRDVFYFYIHGTPAGHSFKPYGYDKSTIELNKYCDPSAQTDENGFTCTAKVLSEGAMNY